MSRKKRTTTNQPQRALLLACGNTYRGDGGVGWRIGCAVEQQLQLTGLTVVRTRQLLPEHAEAISAADIVVFVDCSTVTEAGTVSTILIQPSDTLPRIFPHHLDPGSLLRLALELYARNPARAVVVTVGGHCFELTDRLSKPVKAAVPKAMEAVRCALLGVATDSISHAC
jgi:hydrogenase maturation protease